MGPTNGPEDFSFIVDTLFGLGVARKRPLNNQWNIYIDDFTVRTGRWRHGNPVSDEVHQKELAEAARQRLDLSLEVFDAGTTDRGDREEMEEPAAEEEELQLNAIEAVDAGSRDYEQEQEMMFAGALFGEANCTPKINSEAAFPSHDPIAVAPCPDWIVPDFSFPPVDPSLLRRARKQAVGGTFLLMVGQVEKVIRSPVVLNAAASFIPTPVAAERDSIDYVAGAVVSVISYAAGRLAMTSTQAAVELVEDTSVQLRQEVTKSISVVGMLIRTLLVSVALLTLLWAGCRMRRFTQVTALDMVEEWSSPDTPSGESEELQVARSPRGLPPVEPWGPKPRKTLAEAAEALPSLGFGAPVMCQRIPK